VAAAAPADWPGACPPRPGARPADRPRPVVLSERHPGAPCAGAVHRHPGHPDQSGRDPALRYWQRCCLLAARVARWRHWISAGYRGCVRVPSAARVRQHVARAARKAQKIPNGLWCPVTVHRSVPNLGRGVPSRTCVMSPLRGVGPHSGGTVLNPNSIRLGRALLASTITGLADISLNTR
jgi:hypothetical protein